MSGNTTNGLTLLANPTTITGTVVNSFGSALYGAATSAWSIDVAGDVSSSSYIGILLAGAGRISIETVSNVSGYVNGIRTFRDSQVLNRGTIASGSNYGAALQSYNGSVFTNYASGRVAGNVGLEIEGQGSINNSGTIHGVNIGIDLSTGYVTNSPGGYIAGQTAIQIADEATIVNHGKIVSTGPSETAIYFGEGIDNELVVCPGSTIVGAISNFECLDTIDFANQTFSLLSNNNDGIILSNGTSATQTISLTGQFSPGEFSISSDNAGGTDLTIGNSTLNANYSVGVALTALSTTIRNGASITGEYVAVAGGYARSWTLLNMGLIDQTGTTGYGIDFGGNSDASVQIDVAHGAIVEGIVGIRLGGGTITNYGKISSNSGSSGVAIDIESSTSGVDIVLASTCSLNGYIVGFEQGDIIDLAKQTATNDIFINNTLTIFAGTVAISRLLIKGNFSTNEFALISDSNGGTNISLQSVENISISSSLGIALSAGQTSIESTALISGSGVYGGVGKIWSLTNESTIHGSSTGVQLSSGYILNGTSGNIAGFFGVEISAGSLVNSGFISGNSVGFLGVGTYGSQSNGIEIGVVNTRFGTIIGQTGVLLEGNTGTFTNAGSIESSLGANGTCIEFEGTQSRLIDDPGAVFLGSISAKTSSGRLDGFLYEPSFSNVLELASGTSQGFIAGIGESIDGFGTIEIDTNSKWILEGDSFGLANGQTIQGFGSGDELIVDSFVATGEAFLSTTGLELWNGTTELEINLSGLSQISAIQIVPHGNSTEIILCCLKGTKILTPMGDIAIEKLNIGDPVITRFHGYQRIKWIGLQTHRRFSTAHLPVRISAGALGPGVPRQDLYVSPGHSILIENTLILAKNLINGISVSYADEFDIIEYFNVELEYHSCIFANGCWIETYADAPGQRAFFQNEKTFSELYPGHPSPIGLQLCAPRPEHGLELDVVLRPIVARAYAFTKVGPLHGAIEAVLQTGHIFGWAQDLHNPELPVLLEICLASQRVGTVLACDYREDLARKGIGRGYCSFIFQLPHRHVNDSYVSLSVRRIVDCETIPFSETACATHEKLSMTAQNRSNLHAEANA